MPILLPDAAARHDASAFLHCRDDPNAPTLKSLGAGAQTALGIEGLPWTTHLLARPQPVARMAGPTFITSFLSQAMPTGSGGSTTYRSVANATIAVAGPDGIIPPVGGLIGDFKDHVVRPLRQAS